MSRSISAFLACLAAWTLSFGSVNAAAPAQAPDPREVLSILETNRPATLNESEFNRAAVEGLLSAMGSLATLQASAPTNSNSNNGGAVAPMRVELFEEGLLCLRADKIDAGFPDRLTSHIKRASTNKIKGLVLDLRYTQGADYAAAARAAELFVGKDEPLLDWGQGMKTASGTGRIIDVPVALLVNAKTIGAAEALAAALREDGAALIFGSRTAGAAGVPASFPLSNGQVLTIATQPIKVGEGKRIQGPLKPDIEVEVSQEYERTYYADAFAVIHTSSNSPALASLQGTNSTARRTRFNEADLEREHNRTLTGQPATSSNALQRDVPVVSDPVLARALDVLKGLAVVRQNSVKQR